MTRVAGTPNSAAKIVFAKSGLANSSYNQGPFAIQKPVPSYHAKHCTNVVNDLGIFEMHHFSLSILKRFASCFLAGLLVVLPAVLTIGVVIWVAGFVYRLIGRDTVVGRALQSVGLHFATNNVAAYVIGWVVVLGVIFGLGLLVQMGAKRSMQTVLDAIAKRVPLVGNIYGTSKQLVDMFDRNNASEMKSMSVVWCFFGAQPGAAVLALMPTPERFRLNGCDYNAVLIPTAPVPFGGALVFIPTESVQLAEMSVDGLMSIYVSMGITTPQIMGDLPAKSNPLG